MSGKPYAQKLVSAKLIHQSMYRQGFAVGDKGFIEQVKKRHGIHHLAILQIPFECYSFFGISTVRIRKRYRKFCVALFK